MTPQDQTPQQVQKAFGERVKHLRKQREWSQNTLAEVAGMTTRQLSQIERGAIDLRLSVLLAIAQAFNTTISQLVHDLA